MFKLERVLFFGFCCYHRMSLSLSSAKWTAAVESHTEKSQKKMEIYFYIQTSYKMWTIRMK